MEKTGKFAEVAAILQELEVASVILYQSSLGDFAFKKVNMEALLMDNLKTVLNYTLRESLRICGSNTPALFVAGHSAGASTATAVAPEYPQVTKMLLIAPSADIDPTLIENSLSKYEGELYVVSGDKDYVVSPEAARAIAEWATKAKYRQVVTVPDCDHDFSGERNGMLFSKAYLWAFKSNGAVHSPKCSR
jgi:pimeloyl-ACP methyl ester carboxylesterase